MGIQIEYTDTFAGEANYCWVRRAKIIGKSASMSDRALVRRAKAWAGLTGHRCETYQCGEFIEIRPRNRCEIIMVSWQDDEHCQGDDISTPVKE